MKQIGIRDLRQNASKYIRLVKAGETIEVTERGEPVAVLSPTGKPGGKRTTREQLIAEGVLVPGTQNWADWEPLPPVPGAPTLSQVLAEMRDEERD